MEVKMRWYFLGFVVVVASCGQVSAPLDEAADTHPAAKAASAHTPDPLSKVVTEEKETQPRTTGEHGSTAETPSRSKFVGQLDVPDAYWEEGTVEDRWGRAYRDMRRKQSRFYQRQQAENAAQEVRIAEISRVLTAREREVFGRTDVHLEELVEQMREHGMTEADVTLARAIHAQDQAIAEPDEHDRQACWKRLDALATRFLGFRDLVRSVGKVYSCVSGPEEHHYMAVRRAVICSATGDVACINATSAEVWAEAVVLLESAEGNHGTSLDNHDTAGGSYE
jgi:hypothetical protein